MAAWGMVLERILVRKYGKTGMGGPLTVDVALGRRGHTEAVEMRHAGPEERNSDKAMHSQRWPREFAASASAGAIT